MLRVLLDLRLERGGTGRYGRTLLDGLDRAVPDVEPLALTAGRGNERLGRAALTPWGRLHVRRAVRRHRPELLHGVHLELPPLAGVPCVVTVHDLIPLEHPASLPGRLRRVAYARLVDVSLRRATRIIVPSLATERAVLRRGADRAKLRVIPHAVDPLFRPSSEGERDHARRRFAGGRRYIAASVTARAHKNAVLLAAAATTVGSRTGVPVVSSGPPLPELASLRCTGWLSDGALRSFYGGAEAVVVPSLVEGFGFPAAEALACGVPVVCGRGVGALPYLLPGALVVDVEDPHSVADGLQRLVEDESRRVALGEAGRAAAAALSVEVLAAATADVYREAVASFSKPLPGSGHGRAHKRPTY